MNDLGSYQLRLLEVDITYSGDYKDNLYVNLVIEAILALFD